MDKILLSLDDVSRYFADGRLERPALRHISCNVAAGACIAISGPSGSGKSTLLHIMAGLDVEVRQEHDLESLRDNRVLIDGRGHGVD